MSGASRRPRWLSGRSWSGDAGVIPARLRVAHEHEGLHGPSLPPVPPAREGSDAEAPPLQSPPPPREARPAANSSTHSAARRTVRPSAASVVASISTRSARAHARIGARGPHERAQLPCRQAAGHRGRAGGRDRAVARVDVDVEVHGPAARARDLERLGHHVGRAPAVQLVAVDHRDAELGRAPRVGGRVREVGDADLHDATRIESGLDEAAHGRAVRDAVAQVVVRVDRDEPRGAELVAPRAEGGGDGDRVVAAERHAVLAPDRAPSTRSRSCDASPSGPSGSWMSPASANRSSPRSRGSEPPSASLARSGISAGLYRRSASRIAAGVAWAFVGDSEVRHAGTPSSTRSTDAPGSRSASAGHAPARGQRGSCESCAMPRR